MANLFPGLARGPIDHKASSIINAIASTALDMGSSIHLSEVDIIFFPNEFFPRVTTTTITAEKTYGIVVGGDTDGVYGDGTAATDDSTRAATSGGQGVVVCTQGRCLARVDATDPIVIGDALGANIEVMSGVLTKAFDPTQVIIARALENVTSTPDVLNIIPVDVQREGLFT